MNSSSEPDTLPDLPSVRAAIDELDSDLVTLLVRRQHLVHRAGELKRGDAEVAAPGRASAVVNLPMPRATARGGSGPLIADIYRAMIARFISFERESRPSTGPR